MPSYHIDGPSGSGKSTVGRVLKQRGFRVIETDFEDGLSSWYDNQTDEKVITPPSQPYSKEWIDGHSWRWDIAIANELFESVGPEPVFFCGGTHNWKEFVDKYALQIGLWVSDNDVLKQRLQTREPQRYVDGSVELANQLEWNQKYPDFCRSTGMMIIDTCSKTSEEVADNILTISSTTKA
jgi:hypothetical protein